jgi:hypothetical protein
MKIMTSIRVQCKPKNNHNDKQPPIIDSLNEVKEEISLGMIPVKLLPQRSKVAAE